MFVADRPRWLEPVNRWIEDLLGEELDVPGFDRVSVLPFLPDEAKQGIVRALQEGHAMLARDPAVALETTSRFARIGIVKERHSFQFVPAWRMLYMGQETGAVGIALALLWVRKWEDLMGDARGRSVEERTAIGACHDAQEEFARRNELHDGWIRWIGECRARSERTRS